MQSRIRSFRCDGSGAGKWFLHSYVGFTSCCTRPKFFGRAPFVVVLPQVRLEADPTAARLASSSVVNVGRGVSLAKSRQQACEPRRRPARRLLRESNPTKSLLAKEASDREQKIQLGTDRRER